MPPGDDGLRPGRAIFFNNYMSAVYNPVVYRLLLASPGFVEINVNDPNMELQLFYAYGTYTDKNVFRANAVPGVTTFINTSINQDGSYGTALSKGSPGGYYNGPVQVLPDWVPGTTVTFMVEAWETAGPYGGPTYDVSLLKGMTALWTETEATLPGNYGIEPYPSYPPGYFAAGPPVLVLIVPEPATVAVAGIGLLTLLTISRCKRVHSD